MRYVTVSKRWFSLADTYGIEIEPGQDDVLSLASAVRGSGLPSRRQGALSNSRPPASR
jgi:hypothetical protein